ncbi:hypothetical protein [Roseovarius ramblicola]|uniref:Uncharacterized protein n=1 Tax=Roseovarius ramblicola TaxID=2022336 RepID=A0ABV5HZM8_9RHOB
MSILRAGVRARQSLVGDHARRGLVGLGIPEIAVTALFANSEPGAWYDPSDLSTLFQDSAGTTPVTSHGDPVGRVLDKSGNGNHATQAVSASRPVYQTDDTLRWLKFDGVDDFLETPIITPSTDKVQVFSGVDVISLSVAEISMLMEIGSTGFNAVNMQVPTNVNGEVRFSASDSSVVYLSETNGVAAPLAAVIAGLGDLDGNPQARHRINQGAYATAGTGGTTANIAANEMFVGAQGGFTRYWAGDLYSLVVRFGPNLTTQQIERAEQFVAGKTGVTL